MRANARGRSGSVCRWPIGEAAFGLTRVLAGIVAGARAVALLAPNPVIPPGETPGDPVASKMPAPQLLLH